jgi:hypothetical protein
MTGFGIGTDIGALFVSAFGSADSHAKHEEFLIAFFKILKIK